MNPEELQQAWQSQSCGTIGTNPNLLLKVARFERRIDLGVDIFLIAVFLCVGVFMLGAALRDIQKNWPWLISVASYIWVVGYILFNRWRRRHEATHFDETMLAHVERSIKEIKHRMRLDRYSFWWYLLPIALACMIPPIFFFAMEYGQRPLSDSLTSWLMTEGFFAGIFISAYLVMEFGRRMGLKRQLQELEALRALRDTLLNAED
jgi:positive regulator of sigma E activity